MSSLPFRPAVQAVASALLLAALTGAAQAADPVATPGVGLGDLVSVVLGLAGVLALFAAVVWVLKRTQGTRMAQSAQLEVLGGLQFGMRDRVVLIRAEDRHVLLSVGSTGIRALAAWRPGEEGQGAAFETLLADSVGKVEG